MKISILLPYKENFTPNKAGAVSLFVNDITNVSTFKKTTFIFGNTNSNKKLSKNYINLDLKKKVFQSTDAHTGTRIVPVFSNKNLDNR